MDFPGLALAYCPPVTQAGDGVFWFGFRGCDLRFLSDFVPVIAPVVGISIQPVALGIGLVYAVIFVR